MTCIIVKVCGPDGSCGELPPDSPEKPPGPSPEFVLSLPTASKFPDDVQAYFKNPEFGDTEGSTTFVAQLAGETEPRVAHLKGGKAIHEVAYSKESHALFVY